MKTIFFLGLEIPDSKGEVKAKWKLLAKRYHPDKNGGDKKAEEMLKKINEAYETIMSLCIS